MTTHCIKVLKDFLEKERISLQIEVQGFDRHVEIKIKEVRVRFGHEPL